MERDMIIVGAGIAGLSTGYYAQLNGFQSTIFEMHSIPGGLCTAFKRKGYTFDLSMHMVVGSRSGPINEMWRELGVLDNHQFHYHTEVARVEGRQKSVTFYTDPRRLLDQLLALSPEDGELSRKLVRLITGPDMTGVMSITPPELSRIRDTLKMLWDLLPHMGKMIRYGKETYQDFLQRFRDPFAREVLRCLIDTPFWPMPRFPMVAMLGMMKTAVTGAGVPLGRSQKVVYGITERYQKLGGEVLCNRRVKDLLVENDRAVGVRLEDGTEHRADTIVWAGDGHTLIFDILGGKYLDDRIRKMYEEWTLVQPLVHVSLGVARDLSGQSPRLIFELEEPIDIAGRERRWLPLIHRCFDPSMAPPGKSTAEVGFPTSFEYWEELARDQARYKEEKQRIADATIAELERRWPGFASQIEVVDVATPMTYVRYTGNWKGSPDGWYVTPENMMSQTPARCLPGLSGLHMVGQWTVPFAGTVMSALSGRQLIQLLCKDGKRAFVTSA